MVCRFTTAAEVCTPQGAGAKSPVLCSWQGILLALCLWGPAHPLHAEGGVPITAATGVTLSPNAGVDPALSPATPSIVALPIVPVGPDAPAAPLDVAPSPQAAPAKPKVSQAQKPAAPKRETALPTTTSPTLTPDTLQRTSRALAIYSQIASAGGWDALPGPVQPGSKGARVSALRHRLAIEGDLDPAQEGDAPFNRTWSWDLTEAVKHFQVRMGLAPTGVVAGATLKALNVPADTRVQQLQASLNRLQQLNFAFGDRYVVVNIPSASVEAVERAQVVHRYVAVVGDRDHRSPQELARIQAVNLNPTWTVPESIIKNEIIPHMRKDPGYLARLRIRILDGKGKEVDPSKVDWSGERATNYILRQDSGAQNSLGSIRINMPNKDAVYMHDTPSKRFFGLDDRFLSHGCVRVQGVYDLAAWLLEGTLNSDSGLWDKDALLKGVASQERIDIKLAKAVPVAWVYLTGFGDADGNVQFRDDVYGLDTGHESFATVSGPVIKMY